MAYKMPTLILTEKSDKGKVKEERGTMADGINNVITASRSEESEIDETILDTRKTKETKIDEMKIQELRKKLKQLHLNTKGTKSELKERLKEYEGMQDEEAGTEESEYEEFESEESVIEENEIERKQRKKMKKRQTETQTSIFTIRDVEESLPCFTGDDKLSIRKWLDEFEETGALLQWNDLQMFVYGKRMLKGSARQFLTSQRGVTSWKILKERLQKEFKTVVNSAQVHAQLSRRKRKPHETGRQYIYAMMEIASDSNIEDNALIEHIVDGIQDQEHNKMILKKMKRQEAEKNRMWQANHGHHAATPAEYPITKQRTAQNAEKDRNSLNATTSDISQVVAQIKKTCHALIDSGSELSLISKVKYQEAGCPLLKATPTVITGAGNALTPVIGTFENHVRIENEEYDLNLFVVPTHTIPYDVILGQDFLANVEIQLRQGEIIKMQRIPPATEQAEEVPVNVTDGKEEAGKDREEADAENNSETVCSELMRVLCTEVNAKELDVERKYKDRLETVIAEYTPELSLKPRRLAPKEKTVLNKQIDEWLKDGVIQPSKSEYASPVAIVPKKKRPTSFLRFIDEIFKDLVRRKVVFTYVDDIIIPGENDEQAFENLLETLKVAEENGLMINWNKCQFFKTRIEYLGQEIENGNVYPSESKIKAVEKFPIPKSKKAVQSFLGLTGYFRKFIHDYSKMARPLSDLIKKEQAFVWDSSQREAFQKLKLVLSAKPVLRIYDPQAITELHTDASKEGYGAILLQKTDEDSKFHPVHYYSKKTTDAEKKLHSYELEVLAIINAVKKLRIYLFGIRFKIVTDCEAFKKTLTKKDLSPKVARWALTLEEFDYEVEHRSGTRLKHADALSRHPALVVTNHLHAMIKKKQFEDERLHAIKCILQNEPYDNYFIDHDILMKRKNDRDLIVVPSCLQTEIIRNTHENGHFGIKKMKETIETEYYIPRLENKLKNFISCCIPCIISDKKAGKKEGELMPLPKGDKPLNTYHVDHVGPMSATTKAYRYIFVVIDSFSKFIWLYPTKSVNAKEVINKLSGQQKVFGNPERIISDRGAAFTSVDFQNYCMDEGIRHILVTTGVPRGNGQVERTIRTIIPVLTKLSLDKPDQWYKFVEKEVAELAAEVAEEAAKKTTEEAVEAVEATDFSVELT
ncbi:uncharacterized protein LOC143363405 [Halictus rubicundus]|uniref:uncharacterized protein LOC143363405 n=1 Tax=Halictus rubicundus TaxID=77578 RepID=UPI00403669AF